MPLRIVRLSWSVLGRRWREVLLILLVLGAAVTIPVALHMKSAEDARRDAQLCKAFGGAAAAGAQALVDTILSEGDVPEARARRTRELGALYGGHARYLVLHDYLPFCPQVPDPLAKTKEP